MDGPHLGIENLITLLKVSPEGFRSLWLTGRLASRDGEILARATLAAAERLGDEHPEALAARHNLGIQLGATGAIHEAEQTFRAVLAARRTVLGVDHVDTLLTRDQLIGAIMEQGRFAETEPMYRELIADMARALGGYGPLTDLPDDWYRQRGEILEAVAGAMSDMDDILFHAWSAHTLGTDRDKGPLIGDDDTDDDIVRHAQNVADRLTQQAAKIRASLATAHMVTPSERASWPTAARRSPLRRRPPGDGRGTPQVTPTMKPTTGPAVPPPAPTTAGQRSAGISPPGAFS